MQTTGNGATPPRAENELHLRDAVNLVRRNLWIIALIAASVIGGTAWYTWTRAPIYEARTTILIDTDRGSSATQLAFLSDVMGRGDVETEIALVRARSIAEATVDSLALQVQVVEPVAVPRSDIFAYVDATRGTEEGVFTFTRQGDRWNIVDAEGIPAGNVARGEATVFNGIRLALSPEPTDAASGEDRFPDRIVLRVESFREATRQLMSSLGVGRPDRDATVISVAYTGTDPDLVRRVPDMIASLYMADRSQAKRREADSTVRFLEEQIDTYTVRLRDAEDALLAFRSDEQVVNLEAEGAQQVSRQVAAQAEIQGIQGDLQGLESLLTEIENTDIEPGASSLNNPYRRLAGYPTFLANPAVTDLLSDLNAAEGRYVNEATRKQPTHPDMLAIAAEIDQLQGQLYQLAINYRNSLQSELSNAEDALETFGAQLALIPDRQLRLARLEREADGLERVFLLLQDQYKEAQIAQAVEPGDVRIIDHAILPTRPIRPRKVRSMVLAVLFGVILGVGVAAGRDYLDETVHSREELTRITNLPVLAMIPRIKGAGAGGMGLLGRARAMGDRLVTKNDAGNPVSEAYRAFRTNITFLDLDRPAHTLVLTSPGPAEGKSTSASNLAITLAQQGARTVLVDCDLRKGIVHKIFDAEGRPGITDVLLGTASLDEAVQTVKTGSESTLAFIATGTIPPNPSELIGSKKMKALLEELAARYDKVILDSPPLNLVTDAAVLGTMSDAVILVARAGHTARGALRYARDQLKAVRAPLSGIVLNDLDYAGRDRYYGSGAGYGYYYRYYGQDRKRSTKTT